MEKLKELKGFGKYLKENGLLLPIGIFIAMIILATIDAIYSMVALASGFLVLALIASIVDYRKKRKEGHIKLEK